MQVLVHQTMGFSCSTQNAGSVWHKHFPWVRMRSTYLLQPSGSKGHRREQSSLRECLLLLPRCQPFCPAFSLFLAWRSPAAILSVLPWLRKACSKKTKEMGFCLRGCSVLLPWCSWNGCSSERQLWYLAVRWWDFSNQLMTAVSLVSVSGGNTFLIWVVGMPFLLCLVCKSLETYINFIPYFQHHLFQWALERFPTLWIQNHAWSYC